MAARSSSKGGDFRHEPPGIIDTVGMAFAMLNKRPYLIWVPIALDAVLWTGFRISPVGLSQWVASTLTESGVSVAGLAEWLLERGVATDLLVLLTLLVPTLLTAMGRGDIEPVLEPAAVSLGTTAGALAVGLLIAAGLAIGVTYLTMVGRLIQGEPAWGKRFFGLCLGNSWRLAGFAIVLLFILLLLGLPVFALAAGLTFAGVDPRMLLTFLFVTLGVWGALFFFFGQYAIAVAALSPMEALRSSYILVVRHLGQALVVVLTFVVIRTGTSVALRIFTESPWSVPLALVINAYVATILIAAAMLFYRDRSLDAGASRPIEGATNV
jgi:hypothetical protein